MPLPCNNLAMPRHGVMQVMSRHDQAIGRHDQVMQVMGRHDQEAMTTGMTRLCHNQAMTIGMPCPGAGYDHALTWCRLSPCPDSVEAITMP
eukprot:1139618-Pelagomonas_calceolata.AAC.4